MMLYNANGQTVFNIILFLVKNVPSWLKANKVTGVKIIRMKLS